MSASKSYPDSIPADFASDEKQTDAYRRGWNHGHGIACHNVPSLGDKIWTESLGRVVVDAENIREVHQDACFAAADNSRSYSPFEFTAHEFNEADETDGEGTTESLWEAFERGTADAITADLAEYNDENYGIEAEAKTSDEDDEETDETEDC